MSVRDRHEHALKRKGENVFIFLLGLLFGAIAGILIMAIFVAGKKEGTLRDQVFNEA